MEVLLWFNDNFWATSSHSSGNVDKWPLIERGSQLNSTWVLKFRGFGRNMTQDSPTKDQEQWEFNPEFNPEFIILIYRGTLNTYFECAKVMGQQTISAHIGLTKTAVQQSSSPAMTKTAADIAHRSPLTLDPVNLVDLRTQDPRIAGWLWDYAC